MKKIGLPSFVTVRRPRGGSRARCRYAYFGCTTSGSTPSVAYTVARDRRSTTAVPHSDRHHRGGDIYTDGLNDLRHAV